MISLREACEKCIGKKTGYKVYSVYDFGGIWKIAIVPRKEPYDRLDAFVYLVRKEDGAMCGYFPPTHGDDYANSKGEKIDPPEIYK